MLNKKLEFADGTIIDGSIGYYGTDLSMYIDERTMLEHMSDFVNPEKMDTITYYYGVYKNVYHGFNRFNGIGVKAASGEIIVLMAGEETSVEQKIPTVPTEYLPAE